MEWFPLATAPVSQARRRVSFADEVTTLNEEEYNMLNTDESPEVPPVSQPLTLPVVMEEAAVVSNYAGVRSATSSRIPSIPIS